MNMEPMKLNHLTIATFAGLLFASPALAQDAAATNSTEAAEIEAMKSAGFTVDDAHASLGITMLKLLKG